GRHRFRVPDDAGALGAQMRAASGRKLVVARAAIVVGESPLGGDEPPLFHAMQRVVERALLDVEVAAGPRFEPAGDLGAVHRTPGERFQDEDVEGALEERTVGGHSVSPESLGATLPRCAKVVKTSSTRAGIAIPS